MWNLLNSVWKFDRMLINVNADLNYDSELEPKNSVAALLSLKLICNFFICFFGDPVLLGYELHTMKCMMWSITYRRKSIRLVTAPTASQIGLVDWNWFRLAPRRSASADDCSIGSPQRTIRTGELSGPTESKWSENGRLMKVSHTRVHRIDMMINMRSNTGSPRCVSN